jgi:hypothetical protein
VKYVQAKKRLKTPRNKSGRNITTHGNNNQSLLLSSDDDPKSFKDVMSGANAGKWTKSIGDELNSLKQHNVFTLIPRADVPVGRKAIPSKCVFRYKLD